MTWQKEVPTTLFSRSLALQPRRGHDGLRAARDGRAAGGDGVAGGALCSGAQRSTFVQATLGRSAVLTRVRCAGAQTTIMAVAYDGGVVLGADSRTSTGAPGRAANVGKRDSNLCSLLAGPGQPARRTRRRSQLVSAARRL
jgi:hypothetical protein